ncbi:hypothetical protein [Mangrovibacterium lignilyticum]|nr:hypothetical protein [Mangrovibacterium lignilyticum]
MKIRGELVGVHYNSYSLHQRCMSNRAGQRPVNGLLAVQPSPERA